MLEDDDDFRATIQTLTANYDNLGCIKVKSVQLVKNGERFDIMNANLIDATNVDIYHQYIHTHLNTDADTVKRSIEKRHYLKNQCWRNALIDYYGDTIMSETKRNKLTVERISQIIGRDDFTEKGASIKEMEKVFIEFRISVRILDFFNTLI